MQVWRIFQMTVYLRNNRNVGRSCRVIREITDADKKKLFRDEEIDERAWSDIEARMEVFL